MDFGTVFGMMLQRQKTASGLYEPRCARAGVVDRNWTRMVRDDYKLDTIRIAVRKVAILDFMWAVRNGRKPMRSAAAIAAGGVC